MYESNQCLLKPNWFRGLGTSMGCGGQVLGSGSVFLFVKLVVDWYIVHLEVHVTNLGPVRSILSRSRVVAISHPPLRILSLASGALPGSFGPSPCLLTTRIKILGL